MSREDEYRLTLRHVVKWLDGQDEWDRFKDVPARTANRIADICHRVVEGETLQSAINATDPAAAA